MSRPVALTPRSDMRALVGSTWSVAKLAARDGLRAWLLLWLLRVAFGHSRCPQRTLLHDADGPIVEWPKQ